MQIGIANTNHVGTSRLHANLARSIPKVKPLVLAPFSIVGQDYTDEEMNLPQGHEDRIRTVDLLPNDKKRREQDDDNSVLPTDWLEHTGEASLALDHDFGKGTWKRLMMGDLMTQYGCFYTGCTRHFQMVCVQEHHKHNLETQKAVKVIQEMNIKRGVPPDAGVDKFKKEQAQALKDHVDDLMKRFQVKSYQWLNYSRE